EAGLLATLLNPNGVDKTQNGIARVDRRKAVSFVLSAHGLASASRWEDGKMVPLEVKDGKVKLRLGPGSLALVQLAFK
ncbi:MAG: hypothetical protein K2W96_18980, partial [Gemmataceae bacterium]|nr:hypothetical protein [Gemmataceae bacterium]